MKIYFAGSIRGGRNDADLYMEIINFLQEKHTVLTEHIGDKNLKIAGENKLSKDIYSRDIAWINDADMVVAEVTTPSLGVGYEIGYAESKGVPIVALFRPSLDKRLSAMIAGNEYIKVIEYQQLEDLKKSLELIN